MTCAWRPRRCRALSFLHILFLTHPFFRARGSWQALHKGKLDALCGFVPLDAIQYPHVESIFDRKVFELFLRFWRWLCPLTASPTFWDRSKYSYASPHWLLALYSWTLARSKYSYAFPVFFDHRTVARNMLGISFMFELF